MTLPIPAASPVAKTIPQARNKMTMVRIAVAKLEGTSRTPILAKMVVSAAKKADITASSNQFERRESIAITLSVSREVKLSCFPLYACWYLGQVRPRPQCPGAMSGSFTFSIAYKKDVPKHVDQKPSPALNRSLTEIGVRLCYASPIAAVRHMPSRHGASRLESLFIEAVT